MKAWIAGLLALALAMAPGCAPSEEPPPAELPAEEPVVSVYEEEPEPTPAPTPSPEPVEEGEYVFPYEEKREAALHINPDVVGWICIPGTNIDYPIMFGDKWYYSSRDLYREQSNTGSIYSHLNRESYEWYDTQQNLVIAGANARLSRSMFHELHHVQEANLGGTSCAYSHCAAGLDTAALPDLHTKEGRTWDISICGQAGQWEVWAMYETGPEESPNTLYYNTWFPPSAVAEYEGFVPAGQEEVRQWVDFQLQRSQIDFQALGVEVSSCDQFLTIYTSGDNHDSNTDRARLYFFLKLVNPEPAPYWGGREIEPEEDVEPATGSDAWVLTRPTPSPEAEE